MDHLDMDQSFTLGEHFNILTILSPALRRPRWCDGTHWRIKWKAFKILESNYPCFPLTPGSVQFIIIFGVHINSVLCSVLSATVGPVCNLTFHEHATRCSMFTMRRWSDIKQGLM